MKSRASTASPMTSPPNPPERSSGSNVNIMKAEELLIPLVKDTEDKGLNVKQTKFQFGIPDSKDVKLVLDTYPETNLDEIRSLVNVCIANEWLKRTNLQEHFKVQLTPEGFATAKQTQEIKLLNNSKSIWIKTSDVINRHNGIFTLITAITALAALIISIVK